MYQVIGFINRDFVNKNNYLKRATARCSFIKVTLGLMIYTNDKTQHHDTLRQNLGLNASGNSSVLYVFMFFQ